MSTDGRDSVVRSVAGTQARRPAPRARFAYRRRVRRATQTPFNLILEARP